MWIRMSGSGKKREVRIVDGGLLVNGQFSGNGLSHYNGYVNVARPSNDVYNGGNIINIEGVTGFDKLTVRAAGRMSGYGFLRVGVNGVRKEFPESDQKREIEFDLNGSSVRQIECVIYNNYGSAAIYDIIAHN